MRLRKPVRVGYWSGLDLWERFRFEGLSRFFFSFQTPIRACRFGQRKLTYTSGEAERGRGLIYSDERHR